jgi:hypothetical protein
MDMRALKVGQKIRIQLDSMVIEATVGERTGPTFGWARFKVTTQRGHVPFIKATLTGYAYETIPNKPIAAGKTTGPDANTVEPTTLGKLALGRK